MASEGQGPESAGSSPPTPPPAAAPATAATSPVDARSAARLLGPPAHHRILEKLRRRNVGRVALLYIGICWIILEPVHVIFHMLGVPEWVNRFVVIAMALGFPLAVLGAWIYEVTPEGLKPTADVDPRRSLLQKTGQRLNRQPQACVHNRALEGARSARRPVSQRAAAPARRTHLRMRCFPSRFAANENAMRETSSVRLCRLRYSRSSRRLKRAPRPASSWERPVIPGLAAKRQS